ncbi:MAG TPA: hypothetical protein VE964_01410 [Myxococcales bacterium]|nr:hypothetical protein [Myxococcales bacterium]
MRTPFCACVCLFAWAAQAQQAEEGAKLDPDLLALCKSSDPLARRYCLKAIGIRGDPGGEARQIIADMAARDPALGREAAETYARLYGAPPLAVAPAAPPRTQDAAKAAGDPMRVILAPTAFTRPEGTTSFNAFELGTLTFDHGLTRNLAVGVQTALPIGAFVIGPTLRAGIPFDWGAIGVHLNAAVFAPFVGSTSTYVIAGGGPILTLGNYDRYFNLGLLAYTVTSNGDALVMPHAGFSLRLSSGVRFGAEAYVPGVYGNRVNDEGIGKIGIVLWGIRLFGDKFWGDIAFADPICGGCGDLYRVLPLGIPFLNFGLAW